MRTRIHFEWLIVASVLCASTARAQDGVASVGPGPSYFTPSSYESGGAYCPPGGFQPAAHYSADLYAELLPQDRGWFYDHDSRLDLTLREMFRGSWLRLEFLNSHVERDTVGYLLGAERSDTDHPEIPFGILGSDGVTTFIAQALTTRGLSWENVQGIRGSFGLKLTDKMFLEGSAWGSQEQLTNVQHPNVPTPVGTVGVGGALLPNIVIFTVNTNGVPGQTIFPVDRDIFGEYTTQVFAGDVNLVFDWKIPAEGVRLQPLLGYRHEEYGENLHFGGSFDNASDFNVGAGIQPLTTINFISDVQNHRDEFQFGLRAEYAIPRVTLGLQQKIGLGTNIARSSMFVDIPVQFTQDRSVQFAQSYDMELSLKFQLTQWMNLRLAYNVLWMGRVGVADNSISYNETILGSGNDITSDLHFDNRTVQTVIVGGEVVLP